MGYTLLNEALTRGYQEIFIIISWIYILLGVSVFFLCIPKMPGSSDIVLWPFLINQFLFSTRLEGIERLLY